MLLIVIGIIFFLVIAISGNTDNTPVYPSVTRSPYKPATPIPIIKKEFVSDARIQSILDTSSNTLPEWFCVPGIAMSAAEELIAQQLDLYDVKWYREVSFREFKSSENGYYRYDFLIPSKKLIIEYDSKQFHNDTTRAQVDDIKTAWCWNKGITLRRITNKEYYQIHAVVANLMIHHNIRIK